MWQSTLCEHWGAYWRFCNEQVTLRFKQRRIVVPVESMSVSRIAVEAMLWNRLAWLSP